MNNFIQILSSSPPPPASSHSTSLGCSTVSEKCEVVGRRYRGISAQAELNLRSTKTPQAEISGRKLLRPKPLQSVPQCFCPSPSPSFQKSWVGLHRKLLRDKLADVKLISVSLLAVILQSTEGQGNSPQPTVFTYGCPPRWATRCID